MAKIISPLLSLQAKGSFKKTLTFQERQTGAVAYGYNKKKDNRNAAQIIQRNRFLAAASVWKYKTQVQKDEWNLLAKDLKMTGFNLFIREFEYTGSVNLQIENGLDDVTFYYYGPYTIYDEPSISLLEIPGLRFHSVDVAKGATIISAYLKYYILAGFGTPSGLGLACNLWNNPLSFGADGYSWWWYATRTDPVVWENITNDVGWQTSPDIKDIIQPVVNQDGWKYHNALIIREAPGTYGTQKFCQMYDGDPTKAAKLEIVWEMP